MEKECYKGEKVYHYQRYQFTDNMIQDLKALFRLFQNA
jgi:hypothetical protein